jgi:hypothetical protein
MNFAGYFAAKSMEPEIKKRLFRPNVVRFGNYMATYSVAISFGCALGVTFANHKEEALRLYSNPGHEEGLLEICPTNVSSIKEVCDLERDRMMSMIHRNRALPKALDVIWNTPLPAKGATDKVAWAFIYGTILGSQNPGMVERTWTGDSTLEEAKHNAKNLLREWLRINNVAHGFLRDYFNTGNV